MTTWHSMGTPHINHSPSRYWTGVASIIGSSNFEQPRVGFRTGPGALAPTQAPAIQVTTALDASDAAEAQWRADEHGDPSRGIAD